MIPETIMDEFEGLGITNQRRYMWEIAELAEKNTEKFYEDSDADEKEVLYSGNVLEALEKSSDLETTASELERIGENLDPGETENLREITEELSSRAYQRLDIVEYEKVLGRIESLESSEEFFNTLESQVRHYITEDLDQDFQRIRDLTGTFIHASSDTEEFTEHIRGLHTSYVETEKMDRANKLEEFVEKLYVRALPAKNVGY